MNDTTASTTIGGTTNSNSMLNKNAIAKSVAESYSNLHKEPEEIEDECLNMLTNSIYQYNSTLPRELHLRVPKVLPDSVIATLMLRKYYIVNVCFMGVSNPKYGLLGIYMDSGSNEGIYSFDVEYISKIIMRFNNSITKHGIEEVLDKLKVNAENVEPCKETNLIAVNNGIFDYATKNLLRFSPTYVFTSKSKVNYNPLAQNVVIHNDDDNTDWDVESGVKEMAENDEVAELLWQILGAIIRPNVPWNKMAIFYSEQGNNGKGTLCSLMRNLCGEGSHTSIPLEDFGKDFMLQPLLNGVSAIIVDENNVGGYIDKAANLKAVVTGDTILVNIKFKDPVAYRFRGFMVQCFNEMPRIKDRSSSFFRRQIFIHFTKCFTGIERKYIKEDYLKRPEVLEYVLYRVLHMPDYYEFDIPDVCKDALSEYKTYNDPILQFVEEILPQLQWDLVPFTFLYDLYRAWFAKYIPSGSPLARNTFIKDLLIAIKDNPEWGCDDKNKKIATVHRMDKPEYLIEEYNLETWFSQTYKGVDKSKKCCPTVKDSYRGITRK